MVFLLLVSVLFSLSPYLLLIDGRYCWAGQKLKWRQLAHHQLLRQQGLILVQTEKLKPRGPIAEKLVSSDISHVALASVLLGENRLKKLMIMIIIIIITKKPFTSK